MHIFVFFWQQAPAFLKENLFHYVSNLQAQNETYNTVLSKLPPSGSKVSLKELNEVKTKQTQNFFHLFQLISRFQTWKVFYYVTIKKKKGGFSHYCIDDFGVSKMQFYLDFNFRLSQKFCNISSYFIFLVF